MELKEHHSKKEDLFDDDEFTIMEQTDNEGHKIIMGGGYKIDSLFLQNSLQQGGSNNTNNKDNTNNNNSFENLAVPAGLFFVNQRVSKNKEKNIHYTHYNKYDNNHDVLPDDLMDKLYALVTPDNNNNNKNNNNKNNNNKNNNNKNKNTRRNKKGGKKSGKKTKRK